MHRLFLLIVLGAVVFARPAHAQKIPIEIAELVTDVAAGLAKEKQTEIAVGTFVGRGTVSSAFGPELQRLLIAELTKRKIGVRKGALIEINGDYRDADENPAAPSLKDVFIRINANVTNTKTGRNLFLESISRAAYATNDELLQAFAVPVNLPPAGGRTERNGEIKKAIEKPAAHVANSLIRTDAASPFAVEMLVVAKAGDADPAKGRTIEIKDGLPLVEIKRHEIYRVRIHNDAAFDVAVKLSIDGLDQFAFADAEFRTAGKPKFEYMIVPKKSSAVIRGWFRNLKTADSFLVTDYAKSAVAELSARAGDVGQISVQFAAAWETEEELRKESAKDASATGRGDPVGVDLKVLKRHIGATRNNVGLRYTK